MTEDTTKKHQVINSETGISMKWFETKKEAQEYADFLATYHHQKYEVTEVQHSQK